MWESTVQICSNDVPNWDNTAGAATFLREMENTSGWSKILAARRNIEIARRRPGSDQAFDA
jgi:hypothetical protein